MRRKIFALLLAGALCAGLAACGGQGAQETQEDTAAAADAAAETDAAASEDAAAGTEEAGAADADAAETTGSGKVTVYMPSPAGLADKLAAAFTEKTGIQVEQFQGTTGEILARLETEEANPVADVVILASWSDGLSMKESGQIMSYTPADADKVNEGWIDEDNMLFGYSASAVGVIYNTTIYPELSADWADLAGADYTDDIAIPDPEKSGACKDFLAGMVTGLDNGEEIMQSWADNGLTVPGANSAALESVTTGEKGILIAGAMIMNTAPNADNAKAFIDFLFSDEAQQMVAEAYLLPGRSDIQCEGRTNLADIPQLPTDWTAMMDVADDTAAHLNEICQ